MTDVLIKYRPIRFIPLIRSLKLSMPDSYQDLSAEQFIAIAGFFEKKKPDVKDKILLIKSFLDIRSRLFFSLEDYQVHALLNYLDWIKNVGFDRVFIPFIQSGKMTLCGPKDALQYTSFDEFAFADTYFSRYHHSGDEHDLRMMVASLYRPIIYHGVHPMPEAFVEGHVEDIAEKLIKIDPKILIAIHFNYKVIRRWIESLYPVVFPPADPDNKQSADKKKFISPGWGKVRRAMASGDLAAVERIGRLPVHTVLAEMTDRIKKSRK